MKTLGIIFATMMAILLSSQASAQTSAADYKGSPVILKHMKLMKWKGYSQSAIARAHELYPLLDKDFQGNLSKKDFLAMLQTLEDYYGGPISAQKGDNDTIPNGYVLWTKSESSRKTFFLRVKPFVVILERTRVLPLVNRDSVYAMGLVLSNKEGDYFPIRISIPALAALLTHLGNDESQDFGKFLMERIKSGMYFGPNVFQYGFFFPNGTENINKDLASLQE